MHRSIKIVGISGVGKTTLIHALKAISETKNYRGFLHMHYGSYLSEHDKNAEEKWQEDVLSHDGLILIDEHLEINPDRDLEDVYRFENTRGIVIIEASPENIWKRRNGDNSRTRIHFLDGVSSRQKMAREKAVKLARALDIPFLIINNKTIEESIALASHFIENIEDACLLTEDQRSLSLSWIDYDLHDVWNAYVLMNNLRATASPLVMKAFESSPIPFDPQDLLHQTLFSLTMLNPTEIRHNDIVQAVNDQYLLTKARVENAVTTDEARYLFRGYGKFHPDLNASEEHRLTLEWENGHLVARGLGRSFDVEYRQLDSTSRIVQLFTETLHYIHSARNQGDTFALFFKGDMYPFALETAEESMHSSAYKRSALIAHGYHPDNSIELTRMYTLPGCPRNSISVLDGLVKVHYRKQKKEVVFTRVMPAYAATKGTTVSGGMDQVLCTQKLQHFFAAIPIGEHICWQAITRRELKRRKTKNVRKTHSKFLLPPAVDVFIPLQKHPVIRPVPEILQGKTPYFRSE